MEFAKRQQCKSCFPFRSATVFFFSFLCIYLLLYHSSFLRNCCTNDDWGIPHKYPVVVNSKYRKGADQGIRIRNAFVQINSGRIVIFLGYLQCCINECRRPTDQWPLFSSLWDLTLIYSMAMMADWRWSASMSAQFNSSERKYFDARFKPFNSYCWALPIRNLE